MSCLEKLVFVYDEVLAENGQVDQRSGLADKVERAAEVLLVGQDAEGCGPVLLVGEGNLLRLAVLLNPSLRRTFALEFGDDAVVVLRQSLAQTAFLHAFCHHSLHLGIELPRRHLLLLRGNFDALVGDDFFKNVFHLLFCG